jgi:eukaryotic-like serine/threonine-protein kinase
MFTRITLTALRGEMAGAEFVLEEPGRYLMGRADDCDLCLTGDGCSVSRHHCVLQAEGPALSVRDLGSRNGTYVNGEMIGRRSMADPPDDNTLEECFTDFELNDGDELRVGRLVFLVGIREFSRMPQPV